jgi:predicted dithiol-disulfide oxidoreductase (DUF899 family)
VEIKRRRLDLPWVPVEKDYQFETEAGRRTLADLFEGRSQLLAYNIMFGPDYKLGACPGCTSVVDHLDAAGLHLGQDNLLTGGHNPWLSPHGDETPRIAYLSE